MKLKIDNESIAQEFFENAVLLGIVAPIKDYLFSWHLNQIFGFNFRVKMKNLKNQKIQILQLCMMSML